MEYNISDIGEYFPIKITPGFIAIDTHIGCVNCLFCCCKQHPVRNMILENNLHGNYGLGIQEIFSYLIRMPAYDRARMPIRFGHNTDASLQWREFWQLSDYLPKNYPIIHLRRFPIYPEEEDFFSSAGTNILLKISITPKSQSLKTFIDPLTMLDSLNYARDVTKFFLIGPLVEDNFFEAFEIIKSLPENSFIQIKPLNLEGIENLQGLGLQRVINKDMENQLRVYARKMGHQVTSHLECPLRRNLGQPFDRVGDLDEFERTGCEVCSSRDLCYKDIDLENVEAQLLSLLEYLELKPIDRMTVIGYKKFHITVNEPVGAGDYGFLSKMLKVRIKLSGSNLRNPYLAEKAVLERWERIGFFPVADIIGVTQSAFQKLGVTFL